MTEIEAAKSALRGAFDTGRGISVSSGRKSSITVIGAGPADTALINRHVRWVRPLARKLAALQELNGPSFIGMPDVPLGQPTAIPMALPDESHYHRMARNILAASRLMVARKPMSGPSLQLRSLRRKAIIALEAST